MTSFLRIDDIVITFKYFLIDDNIHIYFYIFGT